MLMPQAWPTGGSRESGGTTCLEVADEGVRENAIFDEDDRLRDEREDDHLGAAEVLALPRLRNSEADEVSGQRSAVASVRLR